jgi:LemA protein
MVSDTVKIVLAVVFIVIVLGILACVGFYFGTHNTLVDKDTSVEKAKSDIDSQYQRRADLIPNLVNTVQGSANFEKSTQTEIAGLRSQAITGQQMMQNAKTVDDIQAANNVIDNTLSRLMVVVEAYPQLQTTGSFKDLMTELEGTENRINYARTNYNEAVQEYKKAVKNLPSSIIANMEGYDAEKYKMYEAKAGTDVAPTVKFT